MGYERTKASGTFGAPTTAPRVNFVSKASMVFGQDQLAPVPATAMRFPVGAIFGPHDSTFDAQTEPLGHPVAESLVDAQQLWANRNVVLVLIYGRARSSEIFAGEKQAEAVIVVQVVEEHAVDLRRQAHKQRCIVVRWSTTRSIQNLMLSQRAAADVDMIVLVTCRLTTGL